MSDPRALARLRTLAQTELERKAPWVLVTPRLVLELLERLEVARFKAGG